MLPLLLVSNDATHALGIRCVFYGHIDHDSVERVGQRPVQEAAGDELFVGDDVFFAVPVGDRGGANADTTDNARDVANGDDIPDFLFLKILK